MRHFARLILPPPILPARQFAERHLRYTSGPFKHELIRCAINPWTGLWLDLLDSRDWYRRVMLGAVQAGKSLFGFIVPTLRHLFGIGESVVLGIPDMEMANDKWRDDLLPAIENTTYRDLLPKHGEGSRGGKVRSAVKFRNGAVLKFMTGSAGDEGRSALTSRVVIVTEVDKFVTQTTSPETDPISQLEARTKAFGRNARIYLECTVSTDTGRIWQEYTAGTQSRIVRPCPHCSQWVTPERADVVGHDGAATAVDAELAGAIKCPACAALWTETERHAANLQSKLIHKGQEIDAAGEIHGDTPKTHTLSFRWTEADNHLRTIGDVAAQEWEAARSVHKDARERALLQFHWALPTKPDAESTIELDPVQLSQRITTTPRGIVPRGIELITCGLDLGKHRCHFVATGWRAGASGQVIDYRQIQVPTDSLGIELALLTALREVRDLCETGWPDADGQIVRPVEIWIDSGWQGGKEGLGAKPVYTFITKAGPRYRACKGYGATQQAGQTRYSRPKSTGATIAFIGENYHIARLRRPRIHLVEVNADFWKTFAHQRWAVARDAPGAMSLFAVAKTVEHYTFANQICAEKQLEEFIPDQGIVTIHVQTHKDNHYLDAFALSCAAAWHAGIRLIDTPDGPPPIVASQPAPPRHNPAAAIGTPHPDHPPDQPAKWFRNKKGRRR